MKKSLSLKWRLGLLFLLVAFTIIVLYFVMNLLYWNTVVMRNNRDSVKGAYTELKELLSEKEPTREELSEVIGGPRSASGVSVAIQGESDWGFTVVTRELISRSEQEFLMERLQENFINANKEGVRVIETGEGYTLQEVTIEETATRYYECYGYIRDSRGRDKKFIVSLPLNNYIRAYRQSNAFFVYLTIFVLIFGTLAIVFLTLHLSRPITRLTEISKRMTNLDFSARYTGDKTDEIGTLGNNMNELSAKLEQTINELRVANEELQRDLAAKEQLDEMRKDFIANVSHELKTPIALIQGYAEGLKDMQDDPSGMNYYIDVITDESDKMNRMVKKLTTLNQLEFGEQQLSFEPFSVTEMVRGIVHSVEKLREEKNATITVSGEENLTVRGSEFEIEEVLTNYVSNAFNHLKAPNEIRISVERKDGKARVTVMNTGDPIAVEEQEKIWIKFYKVDKARTRAYGGSGIGLSIVKAIMDAHRERYGVYNTEDGVAFYFELPIEEA